MYKRVACLVVATLAILSECSASFEKAAEFVRNSPPRGTSWDTKGQIYRLYKQATVGDCPEVREFRDNLEKMKYQNWSKIRGMTKDEAKKQYVELLDSLVPGWNNQ